MSRFVFKVFRRITPLIAHCAERRLTPLLAHCADNKNLSSFENLSDTKKPPSPLSTIWTSQPLTCDVSDRLSE